MKSLITKPAVRLSEQRNQQGQSLQPTQEGRLHPIPPLSTGTPLLQRQCACGGSCPRCQEKLGIQTKLRISEPEEHYEQEADSLAETFHERSADEVMRMPQSNSPSQRLPAHKIVHTVQQAPDKLFRKEKKTVLEQEEITDARIVDDVADVQKIIQDTLSNPDSKLFPYVKDKLKNLKSGKIQYNILDPSEFAFKYRKHAEKRRVSIDPSIKDEKLVEKIGGFYDPAKTSIYLKTRSNYCHAFHETIHSFSSPDFLSTWLGRDLMEGLTQFFTDVVFQEQLGEVCHTHDYGTQLKCARKLVDKVGFDTLASLFFLNKTDKLNILVSKLGLVGTEDLQKLRSDGICKKVA